MVLENFLKDWENSDLNTLKKGIREFGIHYVIYEFAKGEAPNWLLEGKERFHDNLLPIIRKKRASQNKEEASWADKLAVYHAHTSSFQSETYKKLSEDEQGKGSLRFGYRNALLLSPVVQGMIDKKDRFCPACPDAYKRANWESWERVVNPIGYFNVANKIIFAKGDQGISTPIYIDGKSETKLGY